MSTDTKEIIDLFAKEEYGIVPDGWASSVDWKEELEIDGVRGRKAEISLSYEGRHTSFPFVLWLPADTSKPVPCFLHILCWSKEADPNGSSSPTMSPEMRKSYMKMLKKLFENDLHFLIFARDMAGGSRPIYVNFEKDLYDGHWPVKKITDAGYATAGFYIRDLMPDGEDCMKKGIRYLLYSEDQSDLPDTAPGAIACWAFGAMRVMDALAECTEIDKNKVYTAGHSRAGKAAMWTAACDDRIAGALINNSGCCGAAMNKGKKGERYSTMLTMMPMWFAPSFAKYKDTEPGDMPFDQDQLLASLAPKKVLVTSGNRDYWSDPEAEFKSVMSAKAAWTACGCKVLSLDRYPKKQTADLDGDLGYALRKGPHDMTEWDWKQAIRFFG